MAAGHRNRRDRPEGACRLTRLFASLAVCLAGCGPAACPENDHLSTVEFWPQEELLFVASPRSGAVDVMRVNRKHGPPEFVERLAESARHEVVRLAVDRAAGRLWVADRAAVYVYPLAPRAPAIRIAFDRPDAAPLSDLVLDARGNGYVLLHGGATIMRVPADTLAPEKWFQAGYPSRGPASPWTSRAVASRDGRHLFLESPRDGSLLRLDLESKHAAKVRRAKPIPLACSSLVWRADALLVLHCNGRWVEEIALSGDRGRD